MDRRQQKTRQAIFQAFGILLERKSYSRITVQDIIDEANIGRCTFYAHFETKDELLHSMCTDIFHHVFSNDLMQEKNHDFSSDNQGIQPKLTHIFYHLQENQKNLCGILRCESRELFLRYFREYLFPMFSDYLNPPPAGTPRDYLLNQIVFGFTETIRWWITEQPQYTPSELCSFFLSTLPEHCFCPA